MMLFLPPRKIKYLSLNPLISSLNLLFIYPSHLSLSLSRPSASKPAELLSVFHFMLLIRALYFLFNLPLPEGRVDNALEPS
jgi:hypothetical protein